MSFILFLLFVAMPFVELALLIYLGQLLGFWPTIVIVIVTAVIGAFVLQRQGLQTMRRISQAMASGEPPIEPVVDGFFIAIAGAFLLTPGVITDGIGLALLVPPVRRAVARWGFSRMLEKGSFTVHTYHTGGGAESAKSDTFNTGPGPTPGPTHGRTPGASPDDGAPRSSQGGGPKRPRPRTGPGPVIEGEFEEIDKKS
jgi:UPF0716 protein FxsA